ncbi:MAG: hypothetical protein R3D53_13490 [Paracoccaceae bacterium]
MVFIAVPSGQSGCCRPWVRRGRPATGAAAGAAGAGASAAGLAAGTASALSPSSTSTAMGVLTFTCGAFGREDLADDTFVDRLELIVALSVSISARIWPR